ncbi:methyltransferase domain-containing protein [Glaciecola sp. MH2013]|uniref:putative RNA methyltransferase n=1 Tax=Glaciecola sp. MH2013 TaxID=2785524 RepID=UPI00189EB627|nr:methyltransferase domain-containing protein [Glaciecola sp. MH2013]MBF7072708.1 methyltransferase domain-containing protein [Glaciecola sp. MH2013]
MWRCPLCYEAFQSDIALSAWQCTNKHSFDRAKQGYVNLLPVQNKNSKSPGDDQGMIQARSRFFLSKPYLALAKNVASLIQQHLCADISENTDNVIEQDSKNASQSVPRNDGVPYLVYDSGCGEGHYIDQISALLGPSFSINGHDISKSAALAAAKKNKNSQIVVASTVNIPLVNESQDVVYQVFAPACDKEYFRVLKEGGLLVIVEPAEQHLHELKKQIYDNPVLHECHDKEMSGFSRISAKKLKFDVPLENAEQRLALLQMTPYFWKASSQAKQDIQDSLHSVTAHFYIQAFIKINLKAANERQDITDE